MTLKEKIINAAFKYRRRSGLSRDGDAFQDGASFAIKAVIEMLEDRKYFIDDSEDMIRLSECKDIINLLKSEA